MSIPEEYIGKTIEVIVFASDEPVDIQPQTSHVMSEYKGILSTEEANQLLEFVKQSR